MNIVNITTTSNRLALCSATVWSFYQQSTLPDKIIIWVSKEAYLSDGGVEAIPEWVNDLNSIKKLIFIKFTKNTGPYRKIIPALRCQDFTDDDLLVYADDDVVYGIGWFESIILSYEKYNGEYVVAPRVRVKRENIFGKRVSYNLFRLCYDERIFSSGVIITGVGGCGLKKKNIKESLIFLDDYLQISPKTDDIWISKIIELSKTKIVTCPNAIRFIQEIAHNNDALSYQNTNIKKRMGRFSIFKRIIDKLFGYLGVDITNNDKSMTKVDAFFRGSSYE